MSMHGQLSTFHRDITGEEHLMLSKILLVATSIYQYLMLTLTSLLFLFLPIIEYNQYFDSLFVDLFIRCILWVYFAGSYFTIANAIKNGVNNKWQTKSNYHKDFASFVSLCITAIIAGVFLFILTRWSLGAFTSYFSNRSINNISIGNGLIYGLLLLLQYSFLPEK
jgi:Ca2+/Na+ antiporter